jgi:hypothetical protein
LLCETREIPEIGMDDRRFEKEVAWARVLRQGVQPPEEELALGVTLTQLLLGARIHPLPEKPPRKSCR